MENESQLLPESESTETLTADTLLADPLLSTLPRADVAKLTMHTHRQELKAEALTETARWNPAVVDQGFAQKCARSTHRVIQMTLTVPLGQLNNGGCDGLMHGRFQGLGSIAPLV